MTVVGNNISEFVILDKPEFKIHIYKIGSAINCSHRNSEFLIALKGNCEVKIEKNEYLLHAEDIILINPNRNHAVKCGSGDCILLSFEINFEQLTRQLASPVFSLYPGSGNNNESFKQITGIIFKITALIKKKEHYSEFMIRSLLFELYYILLMNFKAATESKTVKKSLGASAKLREITQYIRENFRENISLNAIAAQFYFSPAYFSRYFEKNTGFSFKKYLDGVRFSSAVDDFLSSDLSIDAAAAQNGFPNSKSFVKIFKEEYGCAPGAYKKQNKSPFSAFDGAAGNKTIKNDAGLLAALAGYAEYPVKSHEPSGKSVEKTPCTDIDFRLKGRKLKKTFKKVIGVGCAGDILSSQTQEELKDIQKRLGFEYAKISGLFESAIKPRIEGSSGCLQASYEKTGMIFDFLLSIGLKPLVLFSYAPEKPADHAVTEGYSNRAGAGREDPAARRGLIPDLIKHVISLYGKQEIESWLFCICREPDSAEFCDSGDDRAFYEYYRDTYLEMKKISGGVMFGFSALPADIKESGRFEKFIKANTDCVPDFIDISLYPASKKGKPALEENEDIISESLIKLKKKLKAIRLSSLPVYLTQWNFSLSSGNVLNDTVFKSAYLVKNILDNIGQADGLGYWPVSDPAGGFSDFKRHLYGGPGMFTCRGIKKPAYYAFEMLDRLGGEILAKGNRFIATKSAEGLQLLLYNYKHYSCSAAGESGQEYNDRYTVFPAESATEVCFNITGLPCREYAVSEKILNRAHGSVFDTWTERFNGIEPLTAEDFESLKNLSCPVYNKNSVVVDNGAITYSAELEPHEVRLVEFKEKY